MCAAWGVDDPLSAVRIAASDLLARCEMTEAPTDLHLVGSFRGVTKVVEKPMRMSGRLVPGPTGYLVQLNSSHTEGRKRFSHAHEIGHLLIPSYQSSPKLREDAETGEYERNAEEEFLCDVAASELLMPLDLLRKVVEKQSLAIETLMEVAGKFEVSLEAAGVRLTQCGHDECAVIVWEEVLKRSQAREMANQPVFAGMEEFQPQPRLRIRFAATSRGMREYYFPREKSADEECLVYGCLAAEEIVRGECWLPTGRGLVRFWTESILAPYRRGEETQMRVITLAREA